MITTLEGRAKEVPGSIEKDTGMQKIQDYMKHHRYHVYVPTTIFDPKVAIIKAYKIEDHYIFSNTPETVIGEEYVPLASMPRWNLELRCLLLSRRDGRKVSDALKNLEKRLEPSE